MELLSTGGAAIRHLIVLLVVLSEVVGRARREEEKRTRPRPPQPRFIDKPVNFTFPEGSLAQLQCSLEDLGTRNVIWRKSSDPNPMTIGRTRYVDDERVQVEHMPMGNDWHLLIKEVRLDDEGQYECQVASRDKQLRRYVFLTVTPGEKRRKEIHIVGQMFVEKRSDIRLVCNATGEEHSPDDIDWFFNGQKLNTDADSQISITKGMSLTEKTIYSILEIKNAKMRDAGMYVCRTSDLQITSERVEVLNADTNNVKRAEGVQDDESKELSRLQSLDPSGSAAMRMSTDSTLFTWLVLLSTLSCLLRTNPFMDAPSSTTVLLHAISEIQILLCFLKDLTKYILKTMHMFTRLRQAK